MTWRKARCTLSAWQESRASLLADIYLSNQGDLLRPFEAIGDNSTIQHLYSLPSTYPTMSGGVHVIKLAGNDVCVMPNLDLFLNTQQPGFTC